MKFALQLMTISCLVGSSVSFAQALTYDPSLSVSIAESADAQTTIATTTSTAHAGNVFAALSTPPFVFGSTFVASDINAGAAPCSTGASEAFQDYTIQLDSSVMAVEFTGRNVSEFVGDRSMCTGVLPDESAETQAVMQVEIPFNLTVANMDISIELNNTAVPGVAPVYAATPYLEGEYSLYSDGNGNGRIDPTDTLVSTTRLPSGPQLSMCKLIV